MYADLQNRGVNLDIWCCTVMKESCISVKQNHICFALVFPPSVQCFDMVVYQETFRPLENNVVGCVTVTFFCSILWRFEGFHLWAILGFWPKLEWVAVVYAYNWLIEQGLTSHQTHYRSYRGRFFQVIWPNQQWNQSTEGNQLVLQIRPESRQDHSTITSFVSCDRWPEHFLMQRRRP